MLTLLIAAVIGVGSPAQRVEFGTPKVQVAKSYVTQAGGNSVAAKDEQRPPENAIQTDAQSNEQGRDQSNTDARQEVLLTRFTGLLVAVGVVQAAILGFTIWAINRQTNTIRNNERAWLLPSIEWKSDKWPDQKGRIIEGEGVAGKTTTIYATLLCRNEGRSPAWIVEARTDFRILPAIPKRPDWANAQISQNDLVALAAQTDSRARVELTTPGHIDSESVGLIYGSVKYRDIFGVTRSTVFGYTIDLRAAITGALRRVDTVRYNKFT